MTRSAARVSEDKRLGAHARFPLWLSDRTGFDARLIEQKVVKRLVSLLRGQNVEGVAAHRFGDEALVAGVE